MASGSIRAGANKKIEVTTSDNAHLVNTAIVLYNSNTITVCIRGVKDMPTNASTALINLPSGTAPTNPLYEDYITSIGNHFRLIANNDGKFYCYTYGSAGQTISDGELNKTMSWAVG